MTLQDDTLLQLLRAQQAQMGQLNQIAAMNQRMNIATAGSSAFTGDPVLGLSAGRPIHTSPGFISGAVEAYLIPSLNKNRQQASPWFDWAGYQTHMTRAQAFESLRESVDTRWQTATKYFTSGRILNDIPLVGSIVGRSEFGLSAAASGLEPQIRHWLGSRFLGNLSRPDIQELGNADASHVSAFGRGLQIDAPALRAITSAFTTAMKEYARSTGMTIGPKEQMHLMQSGASLFMDESRRSEFLSQGPQEFGRIISKGLPDKMLELKRKLNLTDTEIDKFISQYGDTFARTLDKVVGLPADLVRMSRANVPMGYGLEMYARNQSFAFQNNMGARAGIGMAIQEASLLADINTPGSFISPQYARTFAGRTSAERAQSMQQKWLGHRMGLLESPFGTMYGLAATQGGQPLSFEELGNAAGRAISADPLALFKLRADPLRREQAFLGVQEAAMSNILNKTGLSFDSMAEMDTAELTARTDNAEFFYHSMFGASHGLSEQDSRAIVRKQVMSMKTFNAVSTRLRMPITSGQTNALQRFIGSSGVDTVRAAMQRIPGMNQYSAEENVIRAMNLLRPDQMTGSAADVNRNIITAALNLEAIAPTFMVGSIDDLVDSPLSSKDANYIQQRLKLDDGEFQEILKQARTTSRAMVDFDQEAKRNRDPNTGELYVANEAQRRADIAAAGTALETAARNLPQSNLRSQLLTIANTAIRMGNGTFTTNVYTDEAVAFLGIKGIRIDENITTFNKPTMLPTGVTYTTEHPHMPTTLSNIRDAVFGATHRLGRAQVSGGSALGTLGQRNVSTITKLASPARATSLIERYGMSSMENLLDDPKHFGTLARAYYENATVDEIKAMWDARHVVDLTTPEGRRLTAARINRAIDGTLTTMQADTTLPKDIATTRLFELLAANSYPALSEGIRSIDAGKLTPGSSGESMEDPFNRGTFSKPMYVIIKSGDINPLDPAGYSSGKAGTY